jgi:tetratricopeptide (TPR) repeat protein
MQAKGQDVRALIELGRYPQAFRDLQAMMDLRPDVSSYARVSYARELQGDVADATHDMNLAMRSSATAEDRAWAAYQLGELSWNSGHVDAAAGWYHQAAELDPSYIPPHAGLSKVAWARGNTDAAIAGYTWVTQRYPSPEYVIALGDLYATTGQQDLAAQQYALVGTEEQLFRANGVNVDLELALFDADHGKPQEALTTARAEWGRRHSVHVCFVRVRVHAAQAHHLALDDCRGRPRRPAAADWLGRRARDVARACPLGAVPDRLSVAAAALPGDLVALPRRLPAGRRVEPRRVQSCLAPPCLA